MKQIALFVLCYMIACIRLSASDSSAAWVKWKPINNIKTVSAAANTTQHEKSWMGNLEVLDMRCEKAYVGVYTGKNQKPYTYIPERSLTNLFRTALGHDSAGHNLLAVVNDLWLNEGSNFYSPETDASPSAIETATSKRKMFEAVTIVMKLKCNMDIFILKEGNYYPLTRLDTLVTSAKNLSVAPQDLLAKMFAALQAKIAQSITANRYMSRRSGSMQRIAENYNSRFNIPALTDGRMKMGIYYTWDQFKNNQPDQQPFRIQLNKTEPPTLYVKDGNGNETITRNVFAISDGKKIYKMHQGYVFDMYRNGTAIYWLGIEYFDVKIKKVPVFAILPGAYAIGTEAIGAKVTAELTPYLLNIETGQEY